LVKKLDITGRRSVGADVVQSIGETEIIGQLGGALGAVFGGGGAFPLPNDPNRFDGMTNPEFVGAFGGSENQDKTLLYVGLGAGALLLMYMFK